MACHQKRSLSATPLGPTDPAPVLQLHPCSAFLDGPKRQIEPGCNVAGRFGHTVTPCALGPRAHNQQRTMLKHDLLYGQILAPAVA